MRGKEVRVHEVFDRISGIQKRSSCQRCLQAVLSFTRQNQSLLVRQT